ncbi:hypothetical protein ARZXY2_1481 [Arthrobacter sp. ZXY-2]|nr:hypothetical protein ARZXY2_1481 [Arthrobacter sp. ZXY-2]
MISRAEAEAMGMSEVEQDLMVAPAHASCNHKAGAKLGNQLRAKAKAKPAPRVIEKVYRPSLEAFFEEDTNTPASCHTKSLPDSVDGSQEATNGL